MTPAALPLPLTATPPSLQAKPSPADRGPQTPAPKRFAEMLQQSRGASAPAAPVAEPTPASAPTAAPEASTNDDGAAANEGSGPAPDKSLPLRPRVRSAATTMTVCSAPTEAESAATATRAANDEDDDTNGDGRGLAAGAAPIEPWRAATASLQLGRDVASRAATRTNGGVDPIDTKAASADAADAASASNEGGAAVARVGRDDGSAAIGKADAKRESASTSPAPLAIALAAEAAATVATPAPHVGGDSALSGAAALSAATPSPPLASIDSPSAPAATLTLATPMDAPDFAAAFGLQVSLLVADGVQQAELHLNPTDLGPVSIHIALAGSEARIDFGADLAATRSAIEQGLPELAGALRDAGFTLAGGGVSQHAQERRGSDGDDNGGSHAGPRRHGLRAVAAAEAPALLRAARAAGAGGVDLYA